MRYDRGGRSTALELRQLACVGSHLDYWIDDEDAALAVLELPAAGFWPG